MCAELEGNVSDIEQQTSADLLRTTLEKIIQYIGTKYGEDIADKIESRTISTFTHPQHSTAEVLRKHAAKTTLNMRTQQNALGAHQMMEANLQAVIVANPNPARTLELVQMQNANAQLQEHELTEDIPIRLDEEEKVEYDSRVY